MTGRTWLLLSWIVVGTAALVAHAVLLWQVLRVERAKLPLGWRLGALIPAVTPFVGWAVGKRATVVVWGVLVGIYMVLRMLESSV